MDAPLVIGVDAVIITLRGELVGTDKLVGAGGNTQQIAGKAGTGSCRIRGVRRRQVVEVGVAVIVVLVVEGAHQAAAERQRVLAPDLGIGAVVLPVVDGRDRAPS